MTAAMIVAAGKTVQKDSFKPEKEIGTITAIERIALTFQQAGIQRIVVVCGEDDGKTEKLVSHMNLVFLKSPSHAQMLDSVKIGLTYLCDKCTSVLIAHVDVPLFCVKTVHALMASKGEVCVPSYHGCVGHPVLLQSEHFKKVISYTGANGLAGAMRAFDIQRHVVAVEDEGVLTNIQGEAPYDHLVAGHDLSVLHPVFRFQVMKEKVFYGPGAHQLLQLTVETGSLLDACRHMGISYTKGRKIIFILEQQMGHPIIESQQGGRAGGGSVVTQIGRTLMASYDSFTLEANQCLSALFQKHFTPGHEPLAADSMGGNVLER